MINGMHHTAISTPDLDRIVAFYRDVVGFEVVWESGWEEGSAVIDRILGLENSAARQAMLRTGNCYLEFFEFRSPEAEPGDPRRPVCNHGYTHICLDVTDIDSEYERLRAAGMTFHCPPPTLEGSPVRATYGRDPDGNVVELQEVLGPDCPFELAAAAAPRG